MVKVKTDHLGKQYSIEKPTNHAAIDRLAKTIEAGTCYALMSDAEWERETIARYKRMREQNASAKG